MAAVCVTAPPRFLIHDRDSRYGASFDRRVRGLGIRHVRTPFRSPRANAVAERWVRSARSECLDHLIVFSEANLRLVLSAYVTYYNRWRPDRSLRPSSSMWRGELSRPATMSKDRRGTCTRRVTLHLPTCCVTGCCALQLQKFQPKTCSASRSESASCEGPPVLHRSTLS
jgi:Integrase core domain